MHVRQNLLKASSSGRLFDGGLATLNILASQASEFGCTALIGEYHPTPISAIVREHYGNLGFELQRELRDGSMTWKRPLRN